MQKCGVPKIHFLFHLFIYLFGCTGSQLWQVGSLVVAPGLLSCGIRTLSCGMHVGSSSLTRDRTRAPCIGSAESYPLYHQGSPPKMHFRKLLSQGFFGYKQNEAIQINSSKKHEVRNPQGNLMDPKYKYRNRQSYQTTVLSIFHQGCMIPASFSTSRLWLISEERFSQFICMHTAKNGACPEST